MGGAAADGHVLAAPADGDPHGRPAGLRQDDGHGQARALPERPSTAPRSRWPPATSTAPPPSTSSSRSGARSAPRSTSRAPTGTRSTSPTWALEQARRDGKDVLIVDTSGRLHVDEKLMQELVGHPQGGQAPLGPARRRRDDRPGRRQRRRAVRRGRGVRRRRHDQARRRRARRRRALGQGGHRQADPLRLHGREARPVRALPPGPDGPAHPRHGRRDVADREGRAQYRRRPGGRARAQDAPRGVRPRGLPRPAPPDPQARARCRTARDDPRAWARSCATSRSTSASSTGSRRSSSR